MKNTGLRFKKRLKKFNDYWNTDKGSEELSWICGLVVCIGGLWMIYLHSLHK